MKLATTTEAAITIVPTANDDAPPCLSLDCPCGKTTHQCSMYGPAERYPGVRCAECGRLWRLDVRARGVLGDEPPSATGEVVSEEPNERVEFRADLAAHDAGVAAKALREAAVEVARIDTEGYSPGVVAMRGIAVATLKLRADQIEPEGQ